MTTDLAARCAAHGWALRKDGDGWELLGNGAPAAFRSEESVRVWLNKQAKPKITMPKLNTVIVGDALEYLEALPPASIPLFLFSPPYNLGNSSGGGIQAYRAGHYRKDAPMGSRGGRSAWKGAQIANGYSDHDDAIPPAEYKAWQQHILAECWRALSDDGAIYYVHKPRIQNGICQTPLDFNPGHLLLRQIVIWAKAGGFNWNPMYYCPTHEWIVIWAKPQFRLVDRGVAAGGDVWSIAQQSNTWHPAPFPLVLAERVIATTMPTLVCDPFIGSGTTAKAAKRYGINWIGCEKSVAYAERAMREIEATQPRAAAMIADQEELFV